MRVAPVEVGVVAAGHLRVDEPVLVRGAGASIAEPTRLLETPKSREVAKSPTLDWLAKSRRSAADDVERARSPTPGSPSSTRRPGARSSITSAPVDHLPNLPVIRAPNCGSPIRREKKSVNGEREEVGVLEEERPLLGKEDLEALVDGDLRLVRLDLAEVGVQREVEGHGVARHQLHVEAGAALVLARVADVSVEEAGAGERAVGNELDVAARRDAGDAVGGGELGDEAVDPLRVAGPEVGLRVRSGSSRTSETPHSCAGRPTGKRSDLEGHRDQHDVAVGGQPALRAPLRVEAVVLAAVSVMMPSAWMPSGVEKKK